jgi:murein DD-endopeptidase MepM/ murein hydrolase activator NlpD
MKNFYLFLFILLCLACKSNTKQPQPNIENTVDQITKNKPQWVYDSLYIAKSFDFPVGKPNAIGYYNAQKFQEEMHLGDDWNAVTGGNTDLGDPIYAIANGYVKFAKDYGSGWGNVIRVLHQMPNGKMVESLYAHCDTILVQEKQYVKKGQQIGTIGTADGAYLAHLHFEIRDDINLPIGPGYSNNTKGYLDPTKFINNHRKN